MAEESLPLLSSSTAIKPSCIHIDVTIYDGSLSTAKGRHMLLGHAGQAIHISTDVLAEFIDTKSIIAMAQPTFQYCKTKYI